jgi:di/tricarboxylate transporter
MPRLISTLVSLVVALWLGGIVFLFIGVATLFRTFPRPASDVAPQAAPALFHVWERYQLVLAAVVLVAVFAWYVLTRARRLIVLFLMLALAAVGGVVSTTLITPRIDQMREAGQSGTPRFRALHARSMQCYVAQAALLMASVLMLSWTSGSARSKAVHSHIPDNAPR